jgi:hypothetical protein
VQAERRFGRAWPEGHQESFFDRVPWFGSNKRYWDLMAEDSPTRMIVEDHSGTARALVDGNNETVRIFRHLIP